MDDSYIIVRELMIIWLTDLQNRVEDVDDKRILKDAIKLFTEDIASRHSN